MSDHFVAGMPVVVVAIYFGAIALHEPSLNASECWSFPDYDWVIYAPCLLSLALNFIFLIDIIRVLWLKLRARHAQEPSQYRSVPSEEFLYTIIGNIVTSKNRVTKCKNGRYGKLACK
jgi:hypothetical protein